MSNPFSDQKKVAALLSRTHACTLRDGIQLRRKLKQVQQLGDEKAQLDAVNELEQAIVSAEARLVRRQAKAFTLEFPANLPISEVVPDLIQAIQSNQVVIVAGETGSGKTTQLPKVCLKAGLGRRGLIGHTQPRRLAARTVANRIAEELNVPLGDAVGFQVRFTDQVGDETLVKLMTDGILLSEIKHDRFLNQYDALIIDEAHERSLNIDFLLGYLKELLPKRPDLKIIITSATIDVDRFSEHFGGAPVFKVSGRTFPVNVEYRPSFEEPDGEQGLSDHVATILEEIVAEERVRQWPIGDVLVFLPGEREIRELARGLRTLDFHNTEILPLYARLSAKEQNRVFQSQAGRRIVLSARVDELKRSKKVLLKRKRKTDNKS